MSARLDKGDEWVELAQRANYSVTRLATLSGVSVLQLQRYGFLGRSIINGEWLDGANTKMRAHTWIFKLISSVAAFCAACGLAVAGAASSDPGYVYSVQGYVLQSVFETSSNVLRTSDRFDFDIAVSNQFYVIYTDKLTNLEGGVIPDLVSGSDGLETFSISGFRRTGHTSPGGPTSASEGVPAVKLRSGFVPKNNMLHKTLLWVALCSGWYLENNPQLTLIHDRPLLSEYFPQEVTYAIDRLGGTPGLPGKVDVLSPDFVYEDPYSPGSGKRPLPFPYDRGYRILSMRVETVTNVANLMIPTQVQVETLVPKPQGALSSNDLTVKWAWRINVTNVIPNRVASPLAPQFAGEVAVFDNRFDEVLDGHHVYYPVTNSGWWLSKDDPYVLDALTKRTRELLRELTITDPVISTQISNKRRIVIAVFVVILVLPLICYRVFFRDRSVSK